jgi:hypothetical protein
VAEEFQFREPSHAEFWVVRDCVGVGFEERFERLGDALRDLDQLG